MDSGIFRVTVHSSSLNHQICVVLLSLNHRIYVVFPILNHQICVDFYCFYHRIYVILQKINKFKNMYRKAYRKMKITEERRIHLL